MRPRRGGVGRRRRTRTGCCRCRCRPKAARSKPCPWLSKLPARLQATAAAQRGAGYAFACDSFVRQHCSAARPSWTETLDVVLERVGASLERRGRAHCVASAGVAALPRLGSAAWLCTAAVFDGHRASAPSVPTKGLLPHARKLANAAPDREGRTVRAPG